MKRDHQGSCHKGSAGGQLWLERGSTFFDEQCWHHAPKHSGVNDKRRHAECVAQHADLVGPMLVTKAFLPLAALNMLTRCQALEYKEDGILCAAIHPGWVKTDMGTEKAELTVEESARGILKTLSKLSEEHSGRFLNWKGDFVAW
uniref:Uncharacterized protein n=1 Tax=Sphaerodactylus townsendi TaxID=933632 RepID=A0ACB8EA23_9SAUR